VMPPLFTSENSGTATVVGSRHEARKSHGVHYTPSELAAFVARRVVLQLGGRETVVLDPACGDGELLLAFALESARAGVPPMHSPSRNRGSRTLRPWHFLSDVATS
jgi:hypothetical protein